MAIALLLGCTGDLVLQQLLFRVWPTPLADAPGILGWRIATVFLSGCLCLVATAPPGSTRRLGGEPTSLLAAFAVLGVWIGNLLPALSLLADDGRRTPPLEDLAFLMAELGRLYGPVLFVVVALPTALVLRTVWERTVAAVVHLFAAITLLSLMAGLILDRLHTCQLVRELALEYRAGRAMDLAWPSEVWAVLGVVLVAVSVIALVRQGHWPAALAWALLVIPLHDVLPRLLTQVHRVLVNPQSTALLTSAGPGLGSPVPLLDLSEDPPRYDGVEVHGALAEVLLRQGYGDMGPDHFMREPADDPWNWYRQRAIRMLPPEGSRVADLTPTIATLQRYGVAIWLWPGRAPEPYYGPLTRALEQPVLPLMWHDMPAVITGREPCWEIRLGDGQAWVLGADGVGRGRYLIPAEIEDLAQGLTTCEGTLLVEPAASTMTGDLFFLLDRVSGTHPDAAHHRRTMLRWPGLEAFGVLMP